MARAARLARRLPKMQFAHGQIGDDPDQRKDIDGLTTVPLRRELRAVSLEYVM